jgi:hypothetical protein
MMIEWIAVAVLGYVVTKLLDKVLPRIRDFFTLEELPPLETEPALDGPPPFESAYEVNRLRKEVKRQYNPMSPVEDIFVPMPNTFHSNDGDGLAITQTLRRDGIDVSDLYVQGERIFDANAGWSKSKPTPPPNETFRE